MYIVPVGYILKVADVAEAEVKLKTSITTYKNPMEESLVEDGDDLGDIEKSSVRMMTAPHHSHCCSPLHI